MKRVLWGGLLAVMPLSNALASDSSNYANMVSKTDCSSLEKTLPTWATNFSKEKRDVDGLVHALSVASVLRYIVGEDSGFGDYYKRLKEGQNLRDHLYEELKSAVAAKRQRKFIISSLDRTEDQAETDFKKYYSSGSEYQNYIRDAAACEIRSVANGSNASIRDDVSKVFEDSKRVITPVRVGFFDVSINSCKVSNLPVTGNKRTEPKVWEGTRFVVIDANFKNQDSEGRLPDAGSLIVKYKGRELRYDNAETIMQEGYGIYFKSVNPLISMPTKIVYRIPNELSGELFWQPGRNPDKARLWCTSINAK